MKRKLAISSCTVCPLQPMPNPEWKDEVDLLFDDGMGCTARPQSNGQNRLIRTIKHMRLKQEMKFEILVYSWNNN